MDQKKQPRGLYLLSDTWDNAGVRRVDVYRHPVSGRLQCNIDVGEGAMQFPLTAMVAAVLVDAVKEWYPELPGDLLKVVGGE